MNLKLLYIGRRGRGGMLPTSPLGEIWWRKYEKGIGASLLGKIVLKIYKFGKDRKRKSSNPSPKEKR